MTMDIKKQRKIKAVKNLVAVIAIIVVANIVSQFVFCRWDLTAEKRFSLTPFTKEYLSQLKGNVMVSIFLDGDELPVTFKRMKQEVKDKLDEFKVYGGRKIDYIFVNPTASENKETRYGIYKRLTDKGLHPVEIENQTEGQSVKTMIFPSAIINYTLEGKTGIGNNIHDTTIVREIGVNLLKTDPQLEVGDEKNIFNSIETLEYEIINAIFRLSQITKPEIAFLEGHGEADENQVVDICTELSDYYDVRRGAINSVAGILDRFKAVVIAKPIKPFSEDDKFVLDQYIMNGGNVLWLIDATTASIDSLYSSPSSVVTALDINLGDMLFSYGARLNADLIRDLQCAPIGLAAAGQGTSTQIKLFPWEYYPVLISKAKHSVTKHLNYLRCQFVGTIDTVGNSPNAKKTVLLTSGKYSKVLPVPVALSFNEINVRQNPNNYSNGFKPVGVLLEGCFESAFAQRPSRTIGDKIVKVKEKSDSAKMIIVSDGDIAINDISAQGEAYPLGFDRNTRTTFKGNKEFVVNAVNYLTGNSDLMTIRMKEVKVRLLDKQKTNSMRTKLALLNVLMPLVLLALAGFVVNFVRKRKYTKN